LITAVVARTAAAEPYNFFDPSAKAPVSQPTPPAESKRPAQGSPTHDSQLP
jgi:hypothetical protein